MAKAYTIGIDYGTNSVRALVVDCADGREVGTFVFDYPSGDQGVLLDPRDPHLARQNPADYVAGLEASVNGALAAAEKQPGFSRADVIGLGVDTTGSTPIPVDAKGRPLALDPKWKANLAAHAWLWKDHTGAEEAAAITRIAAEHAPQYLAPIGGTYSSEWFWSKIWHCLKEAPDVFAAAHSWVELADFVPAVLAGVDDPAKIQRCVCAAGHKAMYSDVWGGLPSKDFLKRLDPRLADLRDRLFEKAYAADRPAGTLSKEWAAKLGLREGIPIAMGAFDAHYGAVGSGVRAGTLVKIIGTSTCDCAVASAKEKVQDVPGICGIVNGSIMPGYYGIEAGQSAVGDILKWWVEGVCQGDERLHAQLSAEAASAEAGPVRPRGPRLEQRQPDDPRRPAAHRPPRRPDAPHDARRGLPRPHRGDGLRRPGHHRADAGVRRADRPGRLLRRHRGEEPALHADLRRRDRPPDARSPARRRPRPSARPSPPRSSPGPTRASRRRRRR